MLGHAGCVEVAGQLKCSSSQFGYAISLDNFPGKTADGNSPVSETLSYGLILMPISMPTYLAFGVCMTTNARDSRIRVSPVPCAPLRYQKKVVTVGGHCRLHTGYDHCSGG